MDSTPDSLTGIIMIKFTSVSDGGVLVDSEDFEDMESLSRNLSNTATDEYASTVLQGLAEGNTVFIANGSDTDNYTIIS
jgi:hypothetical protein